MQLVEDLPRAIRAWSRSDPVMARLGRAHPPTTFTIGGGDLFSDLAESLVHQQVSIAAARTIWGRLAAACGGRVTPAAVLALSPEAIRACGLSRGKVAYVTDLAQRVAAGTLDLGSLRALPDGEAVSALVEVKGVGVWTAQMFLLFALARPDVVAEGDLGLQLAAADAYRLPRAKAAAFLRRRAPAWSPYGSLASLVLWQSRRDRLAAKPARPARAKPAAGAAGAEGAAGAKPAVRAVRTDGAGGTKGTSGAGGTKGTKGAGRSGGANGAGRPAGPGRAARPVRPART